ncbi:hypothetical protein MRX96_016636 [Rhipicephalus microplus]
MSDVKLDSGTLCSAAAACFCCCAFALLAISLMTSLLVSILSTTSAPADEYVKWAVNVDAKECSQVAKEIVDDGGAIGDIAVAIMLCMGVTAPHLVGIGGGFIALYYNKTSRQVRTLNSLGRSPSAAKPDMFSDATLYKYGATASIVPGAVEGYGRIHKELGELEWYRLFDPAIRLAREGFTIGPHLGQTLERHSVHVEANADLKTATNLCKARWGDVLSDLAIHGAQYMYTGDLAKDIADSVKQGGGVMSEADLSGYTSEWTSAVSVNLSHGMVFHSAPIPGSGTMLGAAVAQISLVLVEKLKFAYARRPDFGDDQESRDNEYQIFTEIIDKFNKTYNSHRPLPDAEGYGLTHDFAQDYGGAHVCIIAPSGDAFSITSSLNNEFGSLFTTSSGLLLNNYMDAFVKHDGDGAPTANLLGPSKTPMTSMAPVIVTEESSITPVHSVFGGSGGMAGVSAIAQKEKLRSSGHEVSERFIPSTAIGIMPTRRATYLVINDTEHADGGNTGGSITSPGG